MYINTYLIGSNFTPSDDRPCTEQGTPLLYISDSDELYIRNKNHYDRRTGYLNTQFDPARFDTVLSDLSWYNQYMRLNYILLAAFMSENPGKSLPAMDMLNIGYIPIGYAPSFLSDVNPFIVRLLELRKVPYVLYRSTVMTTTYYKTDTKDVWVSKMDAAKYLNCDPNDVTFTDLLGGLLNHG